LRKSGDIEGSPGCTLIGAEGRKLVLKPNFATNFGLKQNLTIKIPAPETF